jgi:Gametolysin peptidase M11
MRTILLALVVTMIAAGVSVPSASALSGELRVVYVQATWGPEPFTQVDFDRVATETDAYFRATSAGQLSMPGTFAGSVRLPRAVFDSCDATVIRNAAPPALFAGSDRAVIVMPRVEACGFGGEANPTEVLLNGLLYMALAAHELGHTLGLAHASRWDCDGASCQVNEYGNEYSVMGHGNGDLNAFEKAKLQWLSGLVRPTGNATHEIGPVDAATTLPQALVVTTAASEFWFESRARSTPAFIGSSVQPPGVAVIAGPANGAIKSPYPKDNLLLANPSGGGRFAYVAGESFTRRGVFRMTVDRHAPESAALRFEWLDRTAPARPNIDVRVRRGRARVTWDPAAEKGSGLLSYTVLVDGRPVRTLDGQIPYLNASATLRLSRGVHRVGVRATDRAGNRGRATTIRVRMR